MPRSRWPRGWRYVQFLARRGDLIPAENAEVIARRFGPSGQRFVRELPQRLADVAARWELTLTEPLPIGIGGYLIGVRTVDGREAVLKVSPTGGEQDHRNELEAYALKRWCGEGAVMLFEADLVAGALLIERCAPGATIDTLPDDEMLTTGCELARRLHRVADAEDERLLPHAVTEVADRVARFDELMDGMGRPLTPIAERVVRRSHEQLVGDSGPLVVCHGDMNPGNLLSAQRMDWLAVDPLPVRADGAYDAASLVWSKRPWLLAQADPAALLERRIRLAAAALGTETRRVRAWTFARLTGILVARFAWGGYNEAPFISVAELLCKGDSEGK